MFPEHQSKDNVEDFEDHEDYPTHSHYNCSVLNPLFCLLETSLKKVGGKIDSFISVSLDVLMI